MDSPVLPIKESMVRVGGTIRLKIKQTVLFYILDKFYTLLLRQNEKYTSPSKKKKKLRHPKTVESFK